MLCGKRKAEARFILEAPGEAHCNKCRWGVLQVRQQLHKHSLARKARVKTGRSPIRAHAHSEASFRGGWLLHGWMKHSHHRKRNGGPEESVRPFGCETR